MGASKSTIAIFLPIFFSALIVCGVVLCTCAYCRNPGFFTFVRGWGPRGGDSDDEDPEKGHRRRRRRRRRRQPEVVAVEHEQVGAPMAGGYGGGSHRPPPGHFDDGPPVEGEEIDIVEVHPDLD